MKAGIQEMKCAKPMRLRFTVRGLLLFTAIVALMIGWWYDHRRLTAKIDQITQLVQPASTIEGRVTYADSGKPAFGIRVHAQAIAGQTQSVRPGYGIASTDDEGRYKFVDLPAGNWNIFVEVNGWTASAIDSLPLVAGQEVKNADLRLVKGGFIKGRVIDEAGNPVSQGEGQRIIIGVYGPARPKSGPAIEAVYVDSKGEFKIRAPAGRNYPYISSIMPQSVLEGNEFQDDGIVVEDGKTMELQFRIKSSSSVRARPPWPPVEPVESEPSDQQPQH